jgi:hypothetical protein
MLSTVQHYLLVVGLGPENAMVGKCQHSVSLSRRARAV